MSKFKVGDSIVLINQQGWMTVSEGETYKISNITAGSYGLDNGTSVAFCYEHDFELAEDRTAWHHHHDVIVAWAKGAKIECRVNISSRWVPVAGPRPTWSPEKEYRVMTQPDHPAEIAEIERKMRELSEDGKRLADRLEKLKGGAE